MIGGHRPLPHAGAGGETDSPSYDAVPTASAEPRPTGDGRTGAMVTASTGDGRVDTGDGRVDNGGAAERSAAAAAACAATVSTAAAVAAWPAFTPPPVRITARGTGGAGGSHAT